MSGLNPKVTINIIPAFQKEQVEAQKVLFVGQKTASGTATAGALVESLGNANEQDTLFGADSMVASMVREAKKINKVTRFDAISLDDAGAAVAAEGIFTIANNATTSGTITFYVGSAVNYKYEIAVTATDTPTIIGDALEAAITADANSLVTAVNAVGVVTLTAVNKGLAGDEIGLKVSVGVETTTVALTAMTSGATNPTLTNVFDVIGNIRYQTIVWPETYDIAIVKDFLDARFNVDNNILDGVAVYSFDETLANIKTLGNTHNSESLVLFGQKKISEADHIGGNIFELGHVRAAQFAAIRSLRLTADAEISQYVISTFGQRDSFGGAALASLPYFNTPFEKLPLIDNSDKFTDIEIGEIEDAGVSTLINNSANTEVIAAQTVTTYKTDTAGNEDISFKYLNYVDTSSEIRDYIFVNLKNRFSQSRLTEGDVVPNRNMANATIIKGYITGLYDDLSGEDFVLVQDGEAAKKFFIQNLSVTLDLANGKATVAMITPIVTQLRQIIATMQVSFSTNG